MANSVWISFEFVRAMTIAEQDRLREWLTTEFTPTRVDLWEYAGCAGFFSYEAADIIRAEIAAILPSDMDATLEFDYQDSEDTEKLYVGPAAQYRELCDIDDEIDRLTRRKAELVATPEQSGP